MVFLFTKQQRANTQYYQKKNYKQSEENRAEKYPGNSSIKILFTQFFKPA